ncbi:hypothetical protein IMSAGC004_00890 [Bacteroidaceae bacterium]|nr:hypothetical protein IMSAGC004_00890 [Bacteroidaceae bacterium]
MHEPISFVAFLFSDKLSSIVILATLRDFPNEKYEHECSLYPMLCIYLELVSLLYIKRSQSYKKTRKSMEVFKRRCNFGTNYINLCYEMQF